jgi:hypothetical protein
MRKPARQTRAVGQAVPVGLTGVANSAGKRSIRTREAQRSRRRRLSAGFLGYARPKNATSRMATGKMHARALASMTTPENHLGLGILGSAVFSKLGFSARHYIVSDRKPLFFKNQTVSFWTKSDFQWLSRTGSNRLAICDGYQVNFRALQTSVVVEFCNSVSKAVGWGGVRYAASLWCVSRSGYFVFLLALSCSRCHRMAPMRWIFLATTASAT